MEWDIEIVEFALSVSFLICLGNEKTYLQVTEITEHEVYTLRTPVVPFVVPRREDKESDEG
jgi:hypothetical protein